MQPPLGLLLESAGGGIKFWLKAEILRGGTSQIGGDSSSVSTVLLRVTVTRDLSL